jgi:hypothetical protein
MYRHREGKEKEPSCNGSRPGPESNGMVDACFRDKSILRAGALHRNLLRLNTLKEGTITRLAAYGDHLPPSACQELDKMHPRALLRVAQ